MTRFNITPCEISPEQLRLEISYFAYGLAIWCIKLVMTDCPPSGHGQGHVSNFYILDLENFATAILQCIGVINKLVNSQLVDYTYDGRTRWWMHKFVMCSSTVTLLFRFFSGFVVKVVPIMLCSSWQDFDWHIARSICNSRASCSVRHRVGLWVWDIENKLQPQNKWQLVSTNKEIEIFWFLV